MKTRSADIAVQWVAGALILAGAIGAGLYLSTGPTSPQGDAASSLLNYKPRMPIDSSGYSFMSAKLKPWSRAASLEEIADAYRNIGHKLIRSVDEQLADPTIPSQFRIQSQIIRASLMIYEGEPDRAYQAMCETRTEIEANPAEAEEWLYTIIYYQGLIALRRGETDNCILCRGES